MEEDEFIFPAGVKLQILIERLRLSFIPKFDLGSASTVNFLRRPFVNSSCFNTTWAV